MIYAVKVTFVSIMAKKSLRIIFGLKNNHQAESHQQLLL